MPRNQESSAYFDEYDARAYRNVPGHEHGENGSRKKKKQKQKSKKKSRERGDKHSSRGHYLDESIAEIPRGGSSKPIVDYDDISSDSDIVTNQEPSPVQQVHNRVSTQLSSKELLAQRNYEHNSSKSRHEMSPPPRRFEREASPNSKHSSGYRESPKRRSKKQKKRPHSPENIPHVIRDSMKNYPPGASAPKAYANPPRAYADPPKAYASSYRDQSPTESPRKRYRTSRSPSPYSASSKKNR